MGSLTTLCLCCQNGFMASETLSSTLRHRSLVWVLTILGSSLLNKTTEWKQVFWTKNFPSIWWRPWGAFRTWHKTGRFWPFLHPCEHRAILLRSIKDKEATLCGSVTPGLLVWIDSGMSDSSPACIIIWLRWVCSTGAMLCSLYVQFLKALANSLKCTFSLKQWNNYLWVVNIRKYMSSKKFTAGII